MLTKQDITKFRKLYKQEFGVEISEVDAREQGTQLLNLMSVVYKPMTQEESNQINEHSLQTKTFLIERLSNTNNS